MNVTGETKKIPLFSIIRLEELYKENHLEDVSLTDFYVDRNQKVYLLIEKSLEQERKDTDWFLTASDYTAVELKVDWTEKRVLETILFPLGAMAFQFHYLRPVGDDFLLLGARCAYRKKAPDKNAWLVRRDGTVLSRFCLGDGIEECIVRSDSTIITSYFDEGVFGNNGWGCTYHGEYVPPVGECGLIVWTAEGFPSGKMSGIPLMTVMPSVWMNRNGSGFIIIVSFSWCEQILRRIWCFPCHLEEAELLLLPHLEKNFCAKADMEKGSSISF